MRRGPSFIIRTGAIVRRLCALGNDYQASNGLVGMTVKSACSTRPQARLFYPQ
jgi:hypothetical protein